MPRFFKSSPMPVGPRALFDWHARPGAFERLAPPWQTLTVLQKEGTIRDGDRLVMALGPRPLAITWEAHHEGFALGERFTDVQVRGPFAAWRHTHRFLERPEGGSILEDDIEYRLPLGALGEWVAGRSIRAQLDRMFTFRHERTMDDLRRHAAFADRPPLKIAITGASGLVGTALTALLTTGGHLVRPVVRREPRAGEIQWSVDAGTIDVAGLEGLDAVVHLAGENIGGGLWTKEHKRRVLDSRVLGTRLLAAALANLKRPPRALISASAIGIYGDRGDALLTEESPPGDLFISEVCAAWEAAAEPARAAGIRVVHPRIGVVLSAQGGALKPMLLPFKAGLGGPVGSGAQVLSWISLDDTVAALHHLIMDERARGPVNLVAPNPAPQRDFARTLGAVLGRPALLPLPAFAVKTLMGQMGRELLLASQRVAPAQLEALGFRFTHPELEGALRAALGR